MLSCTIYDLDNTVAVRYIYDLIATGFWRAGAKKTVKLAVMSDLFYEISSQSAIVWSKAACCVSASFPKASCMLGDLVVTLPTGIV